MTDNPNPTNATAEPGAAAGAAESDINELLNEFDDKAPKQPAQPTTPAPQPRTSAKSVLDKLTPVFEFVETERAQKVKAEFDKAVNEAVSTIKADDTLKSLPDPFVRGYLHDFAQSNPDFDKAFRERAQNPAAWQSALDGAAKKAAEAMKGTPEPKVAETIAAARAAVAGDSATVPTDSDKPDVAKLNAMSDAEFQRYKQTLNAKNARR